MLQVILIAKIYLLSIQWCTTMSSKPKKNSNTKEKLKEKITHRYGIRL